MRWRTDADGEGEEGIYRVYGVRFQPGPGHTRTIQRSQIEAQCADVIGYTHKHHASRHHRAPRHDCGAWLRGVSSVGGKQTRGGATKGIFFLDHHHHDTMQGKARQGKTCGRREAPNCTAITAPVQLCFHSPSICHRSSADLYVMKPRGPGGK